MVQKSKQLKKKKCLLLEDLYGRQLDTGLVLGRVETNIPNLRLKYIVLSSKLPSQFHIHGKHYFTDSYYLFTHTYYY